MYEVVEGIKLEARTCKMCVNVFKVMPSHPQIYCSEFCEQKDKGKMPFGKSKDMKKKRKLKHKVQESDYANKASARRAKKTNSHSRDNDRGSRRRKVSRRVK